MSGAGGVRMVHRCTHDFELHGAYLTSCPDCEIAEIVAGAITAEREAIAEMVERLESPQDADDLDNLAEVIRARGTKAKLNPIS